MNLCYSKPKEKRLFYFINGNYQSVFDAKVEKTHHSSDSKNANSFE